VVTTEGTGVIDAMGGVTIEGTETGAMVGVTDAMAGVTDAVMTTGAGVTDAIVTTIAAADDAMGAATGEADGEVFEEVVAAVVEVEERAKTSFDTTTSNLPTLSRNWRIQLAWSESARFRRP